ncbi:MAG: M48 family metalloprotease [Planctomycetes bacterium]|nr:M48 family metalloprotease [Planctomycetota bacterium]
MEFFDNILTQAIVQRLGWMLVHFVWQAATVALVLAILLKMLRKSSPNLLYIVACLGLVAVVAGPVVTMNLIPVDETYLPVEAAVATALDPEPVADISAPVEIEPSASIEMPAIDVEFPTESIAAAPAIPLRQRITEILEPNLPYLVMAWLLGVFGLSVWYLGGWTQLQKLRRKMVKPVDERLRHKLKELSALLGVNRAVEIVESALVESPAVIGWLKPVILLPASILTGFSAEQIEAILAHELAHIKRCDYLVNMLQTGVEILGFYHPAVWWISKKIRAERENCCDDIAVKVSGDRVEYAKTLALFDGIRASKPELAVAASGGSLFQRICRLVQKDSIAVKADWKPSFIAALLVIALLIPTGFALTERSEEKPDVLFEPEVNAGETPSLPWVEERTVNFPADRSVGMLKTRKWNPVAREPDKKLAEACGKVHIPAGHLLGLEFARDKPVDLSPLANLKPTDLQHLYLYRTKVQDADLQHISRLTGLRQIGLGMTNIGDEGLAHIAGLKSLKELNIAQTKVTDAGLVHLAKLSELETLSLKNNSITDKGLIQLGGLKKLEHLILTNTKITDQGLIHLKKLNSLIFLSLSNNDINGEGLEHLAGLSKLKYLNLKNTSVSKSALKTLTQALENCKIMHSEIQSSADTLNSRSEEKDLDQTKKELLGIKMESPREKIVLTYLPSDQRNESGRKKIILSEGIKDSVDKLASYIDIPLGMSSDSRVDDLEVTFADLRVRKLITYARKSKEARKHVIDTIMPTIRNYTVNRDEKIELGSKSFSKGWRSGYDKLLAVLVSIDHTDNLPLVLRCFELHQAEINNHVDKIKPEFGRWLSLDYGHNGYFSMYLEKALNNYINDKSLPPSAKEIVKDFVTKRKRVDKISHDCGTHKITINDVHNGYASPIHSALNFKKAMQKAGKWKKTTPSSTSVSVTGRVVDVNGQPLTDVRVEATPMRCSIQRKTFMVETRSGKDGRYVISNAIAGEDYLLEFNKGGFRYKTDRALSGAAKEKITILSKAKTHRLTGKISHAQTGNAAASAKVTVIGRRSYKKTVLTDEKGNFVFDDLPKNIGQGVIYARKGIKVSEHKIIRKNTSNISLALNRPGVITGTVTSKTSGKPIPGCIVKARPWYSSGFYVETTTDPDGTYSFNDLPHGRYLVWPRHTDWFQPQTRTNYLKSPEMHASPSKTSTYNVKMLKKATVIGKVIDPDKKPVSGAMVGVNSTIAPYSQVSRETCRTDKNGIFKLKTGFLESTRQHTGAKIAALADGLGMGRVVLKDLAEGEIRDRRDKQTLIKLSGVMSVSGYVKDPSGKPIPGVFAVSYNNQQPYCKTDESGYYKLDNIVLPLRQQKKIKIYFTAPRPDNGQLNMITSLNNYKPAIIPDSKTQYYLNNSDLVTAKHATNVKLDVKLTPTEKLYFSGKVTDESGKPIPQASLLLCGGNIPADRWKIEMGLEMMGGKLWIEKKHAKICRTVTDNKGNFRFCVARESKTQNGMPNAISKLDPTLFSIAMVTPDKKSKLVHNIILPKDQTHKTINISLRPGMKTNAQVKPKPSDSLNSRSGERLQE